MSGQFPNFLKIARVIPIFKSGDALDLNNYRPISILSTFSKIYERVVHSQLLNYFETKGIFYKHQYGFRSYKSTTQAVLNFLHNIYSYGGSLYFTIFLDMRKAFDCVSHEILLDKMYFYGIRGTPHEWFRSYLSDREQYVSINDGHSNKEKITCGVPQGSILGLLFLIFINDVPNCCNNLDYLLFADDTSISLKIPKDCINSIHHRINHYLCSVSEWLGANKIMLHVQKTKYMLFSYKGNYRLQPIRFDAMDVEWVSSMRYLGLIFDSNLNFKSHVDIIASKMSKNIGIMCKVSNFLPRNVLLSIYYAIIHPYLNYCIEAWYSGPQFATNK